LNQIAAFQAKVASGNGEQTLSRDIYRLGQLFDFFRMLSFFFNSVGFYWTTLVRPQKKKKKPKRKKPSILFLWF
jgi:callose synthase